jgi:hypothetical protein
MNKFRNLKQMRFMLLLPFRFGHAPCLQVIKNYDVRVTLKGITFIPRFVKIRQKVKKLRSEREVGYLLPTKYTQSYQAYRFFINSMPLLLRPLTTALS